ncbi:hypothetical protein EBR25_07915 [bacterium]|nr:hypothetical protein [bacterium]
MRERSELLTHSGFFSSFLRILTMKHIVRHSSHKKAAANLVKLLVTLSIFLGLSGCIFAAAEKLGNEAINLIQKGAEQGVTGAVKNAAKQTSRDVRKSVGDILKGRAVVSCDDVKAALDGLENAIESDGGYDGDLDDLVLDFSNLLEGTEKEAFLKTMEQLLDKAEECRE